MSLLLRRIALALGIVIVVGIGGSVAWYSRATLLGTEQEQEEAHDSDEHEAPVMKVVRPHINESELVRSVTQPVFVQPLYKADLMAQVAGPIKAVHKNIGDSVKKGEVILELHVPELVSEVAQKEAMIKLAEQEVKAAESTIAAVTAAVREAEAGVREKQSEVQRALARQKYAKAGYTRISSLVRQNAVEASLVDEKLRNVEAGEAEYKSSLSAVETARANAEEFQARLASARVEVEVKKARVAVARADRDHVQALVDFARVTAPFDGRVVARMVDPGAFVQNASTGQPRPLMTIVRTDRVTLVMWVPEREAALVREGQEATVRLDALGREEIRAKVSRLSYWLDPEKSRDMRVEVDLDNAAGKLRVGMYGSMTLELQRFERAPLLPSSAVFTRGGRTWIAEVRADKVYFTPVRVQLEDGIRVKVVKLVPRTDPKTHQIEDVAEELRGDEVVLRSRQNEVTEGQQIQVKLEDW